MALIACPECSKEISEKSINCIHCGFPLSDDLAFKKITCKKCKTKCVEKDEYCTSCGWVLKETNQPYKVTNTKNNDKAGIAAVLSFVLPGLGYIYVGELFKGIIWLFIVAAGYSMFVFPGIVLHLACIVKTHSKAKSKAT
jgi:hypothetical protein